MSATTELWINNQRVDLKEDFPISLNYSIADISKPDTRQTSYSKTISIPASKDNRQLFSYIFELSNYVETSGEVNYTPDFNPNLKATAIVLCDGIEVFNGIAQLLKIEINENNKIEFEIVLTGQLTNLFKNIGDKELTDIDFSDLDHDYTLAEIEASWSNSSGFVYPLIDYGKSQSLTDFPINSIYPAIFVKDYIDRIFSGAGCVYDSDFFNSDYFKSLIIPFNGSNFKISNSDILDRKFRASRETTDQSLSISSTVADTKIIFNDDSTSPNFDTSAQYGTGTGNFVVATGLQGTFNFGTVINVNATYTPDTPGIDMRPLWGVVTVFSIIKQDAAGNNTVLNSFTRRIRPGSGVSFPVNTSYETDYSIGYPNNDYEYQQSYVFIQSGAITLIATDKVFVLCSRYMSNHPANFAVPTTPPYWGQTELFVDSSGGVYDGTYGVKVKVDSYFYNEISNADYVEGLPISMNNAVAPNIKQKDFLMSIIKMFNLYLEQDKNVSQKFIIEPRDDGYYLTAESDVNVIDLSDKIDTDKNPLEIEPMGALDFKRYHFKYRDDKDYFNQKYLNAWGETYSERQIQVLNDFIQQVKTTDVIFSATPSVGDGGNDRVIPRILNIDTDGTSQPVTSNIRILIWGGLKDTGQVWNITDSSGQNPYTQYPYCGMLDDPYSPVNSLDWEVPDEIYWTNAFQTITYTNKNLYNVYWKKFIDEITNRNSSIVRGMFDIRPYDFTKLDFRKIYFFENEYFRLNKIINYMPTANGLTKLEFIKVNEGINTQFDFEEATDVFVEDQTPRLPRQLNIGNNLKPLGITKISGSDNRVADSVKSASVIGDRNSIGEFAEAIFITGSDNNIGGDSSGVVVIGHGNRVSGSNVVLINTNNKTINTNNTTFIGGRAVEGDGSVIMVTSDRTIVKNADDDATTYLVDATSGNITINLFEVASWPINVQHNFKKIDSSSNTVTIEPNASETIDGASNYVLTVQNECIAIISDGSNFYIIS